MKKNSILFIIIGILFSSLGSKMYINNEEQKKVQKEIYNSVPLIVEISNDESIIIDRNNILKEYGEKINILEKSLKRNEYNSLYEEINKIKYDDIKKQLSGTLLNVEKLIVEKEEKAKKYSSKESLYGKVSAYTPYCSDGCNGYTANGMFVGNTIYYNDKEYGKVRIVAADKSYPFGTIVRFNNLNYFNDAVYAIVLDRGGAIGKGKRVLFDLLFKTENEANNFGIEKNVSCDILRMGY